MGIRSETIAALVAQRDLAQQAQKEAQIVIAHSSGQIDRLTKAIEVIKSTLTSDDDAEGTPAKRTRSAPAKSSALPKTDNPFWLALITATPQKAPEILRAAIEKAGISPTDKAAVDALKGRMAQYLKKLNDAKLVASEGAQQSRVYFLPKAA